MSEDIIGNPQEMLEYGCIKRKGYRNNMTDGESDILIIHVPTKKIRRFHGTFYDTSFGISIECHIKSFPRRKDNITVEQLNHCYTMLIDEEKEIEIEG